MENDPATGRTVWEDGSFTGIKITSGEPVWSATYTVDKDTPAGEYTIHYDVKAIVGGTEGYDGDDGVGVLTANIKVTRKEVHTHTYGEPTYTWDGKTCTATATCVDGDDTITEKVTATETVVKAATKDEEGEATYTATFKNPLFAAQTKTGIVIPKIAEYELYLQPIAGSKDEDFNVSAGDIVPVGLYLLSSSDAGLETFEAMVKNDSGLTVDDVKLEAYNLTYEKLTAPTLSFQRNFVAGSVDLKANTPVLLATINYVVPDTAASGDKFVVTIDETAQIGIADKTVKDSPRRGDATLVIAEEFTTTFVDEDGNEVAKIPYKSGDPAFTDPEVPAKDGYDGAWENHSNQPTSDQTVKPVYTPIEYDLTFVDENGDPVGDPMKHTVESDPATITKPAVPDKPGYTGEWDPEDLAKINQPGAVTVKPVYTPATYTITYSGDDVPANITQDYTIESTDTLRSDIARANYQLVGWKVKADSGNWVADDTVLPLDTTVTGQYGNVTLQAVWTLAPQYVTEDYRYANSEDVLLIVNDTLEANESFAYDGNVMFYTTDENYYKDKNGKAYFEGDVSGVYVYIIPYDDDIASKISITNEESVEIERDGDVNLQDGLDIQDSNVVYQMLIKENRYSNEQLGVRERLEADVVTPQDDASLRGSIADAKKILEDYYAIIHAGE